MESSPHGEDHLPLDLAYQVAALQNGGIPLEPPLAVPQSISEVSNDDNSGLSSSQHDVHPGHGSDERDTEASEGSVTGKSDGYESAEVRLARSRERNREHAKRTRMRKKVYLESLQSKVKGLEAERQVLKQSIEECGIASILVGLSSGEQDSTAEDLLVPSSTVPKDSTCIAACLGGKRRRFLSEAMADQPPRPLKVDIDGRTALIGGGKSHINWKTGVYSDEDGIQRQLTPEQLETLRRERNRMHAKMTRDRKKCFIKTIEKTIEELERGNQQLRDILSKVSVDKYSQMVTPITSPALKAASRSRIQTDEDTVSIYSQPAGDKDERPAKRRSYDLSLVG